MEVRPIIVSHQTVNAPNRYPQVTGYALAYTQISLGGICILLEILNLVTCPFPVGAGIWSGLFYVSSGIVGVFAARTRGRCPIIGFMIMSIISAVVGAVAVGMAATNAAIGFCDYINSSTSLLPALVAAAAFINLVVAVVSSAICCGAVCGCEAGCCGQAGQEQQQQHGYYGFPGSHGAAAAAPNLPPGAVLVHTTAAAPSYQLPPGYTQHQQPAPTYYSDSQKPH